MWYKSPLRTEERTASFCVSENGMYDFGTSTYYDIFDFTKNLFKINLIDAAEMLAKDFDVPIKNEPLSKEEIEELKEKRTKENEYREKVENFYNNINIFVVDELKNVSSTLSLNNTYLNYLNKNLNSNEFKLNSKQDVINIYETELDKTLSETFNIYKYRENLIFTDSILDNIKKYDEKNNLYYLNNKIRSENKGILKEDFFPKLNKGIEKSTLLSNLIDIDYIKYKTSLEDEFIGENIYNMEEENLTKDINVNDSNFNKTDKKINKLINDTKNIIIMDIDYFNNNKNIIDLNTEFLKQSLDDKIAKITNDFVNNEVISKKDLKDYFNLSPKCTLSEIKETLYSTIYEEIGNIDNLIDTYFTKEEALAAEEAEEIV